MSDVHRWKKYKLDYEKIYTYDYLDDDPKMNVLFKFYDKDSDDEKNKGFAFIKIDQNTGNIVPTLPVRYLVDRLMYVLDSQLNDKKYYELKNTNVEPQKKIYEIREIEFNRSGSSGRDAFLGVTRVITTKVKEINPKKSEYIEDVFGSRNDYPDNGEKNGFWYEYDGIKSIAPKIETASADLGKITSAFSVDYKVVDPDEGQTWKVTESLDGKVLKTFTAKVGTSYTSKMSPSEWQKVLNGKHILKIEVVDSDGGKSAKEITFEKDVRKLDFMLDKSGVQGIDKMPERAILSMSANIPAEASIKIEITNNGLDTNPVWQDCTAQVLGNEKIFFSNKTKTADKWAVNLRVTGDKKTSTEVLSVSIIGGFYD